MNQQKSSRFSDDIIDKLVKLNKCVCNAVINNYNI